MSFTADAAALDRAFLTARTANRFLDKPVDDATLDRLVDLFRWGPTSMNCQPARLVFLRSAEARRKLEPALMPNNAAKTLAAPVTVIVAQDTRFHEQLAQQFPAVPGIGGLFAHNAELARETALRNSSLQGGYLILAARLLGLDAGPMSGFDAAQVNSIFFPEGSAEVAWKVNFILNLGYGDAAGNHPRGPRLSPQQITRVL